MRLEPSFTENHKILGDNFNSIKVRLELAYVIRSKTRNKFQFHKGAIRTDGAGVVGDEFSQISIP